MYLGGLGAGDNVNWRAPKCTEPLLFYGYLNETYSCHAYFAKAALLCCLSVGQAMCRAWQIEAIHLIHI